MNPECMPRGQTPTPPAKYKAEFTVNDGHQSITMESDSRKEIMLHWHTWKECAEACGRVPTLRRIRWEGAKPPPPPPLPKCEKCQEKLGRYSREDTKQGCIIKGWGCENCGWTWDD